MNNGYLRTLYSSALGRLNNGTYQLSYTTVLNYLEDSRFYMNLENNPFGLSLLGSTFYKQEHTLLQQIGVRLDSSEDSSFVINDNIEYQKQTESSVYSKEFSDVIKLCILSEYLENNLIVGVEYNRTYEKDGDEVKQRSYLTRKQVEDRVKDDIKLILEDNKSLIASYSTSEFSIDIDDIFRIEGYTIISRFRDNTIEDLINYYGDKIVIKISKLCYYVNGKGLFIIIPTNYLSCLVDQHIYFLSKVVATRSSQTWFYKNKEYLLSLFKNEKIKGVVSKIIEGTNDDELNTLAQDVIVSTIKRENKKINKHNKDYLAECVKNNISYYTSRYDINTSIENLKSDIKSKNRAINEELKDAYQSLRNFTLQLDTLESNLEKSGVNPEVSKAIKYLEKAKSSNLIRDYFIDLNDSAMIIHTNWLKQKFVELNNLNKRYLNDCIRDSYRSIMGRVDEPDKYIDERNKYIESILNYEDKYSFVIMPTTIVIKFSSTLDHGFGYEYFCNELKRQSLMNGHSKYFSADISYDHIPVGLTRGCLGSSANIFQECGSEYNLTKYISLLLQYLQTFIPLDSAGDFSLIHNPIIDNEGKVVSFLDDVTVIGKYINENPTPQARAFIDKKENNERNEEEENNGN